MTTRTRATTPPAVTEVLAAAAGRQQRQDAALPRTGGPAGNAQLTAWLGLALLVLFLAELSTLINITGLLTWHIVLGVVLIPPALAKTATTSWRILRYYTGNNHYRGAGPPPLLLRLLGPLVILGTVAVLASGVLLIGLGPTGSFQPWFSLLGHGISPLTVHQAAFIFWAAATGLHVLARTVPAARLALAADRVEPLPGTPARVLLALATTGAAAVVSAIVLHLSTAWTNRSL